MTLEHTSKVPRRQSARRSARARSRRVAAAAVRRGDTAARSVTLPGALRPRRLHRTAAARAHGVAQLRRERARARPRASCTSARWARRSLCSPIASRRSAATSTSTRARSAATPTTSTRELVPFVDRELRTLAAREHRGVLRQVVGRLRRDDPRDEVLENLGCAAAAHSGDAGSETLFGRSGRRRSMSFAKYCEPPLSAGEHDAGAAAKAVGSDGADDGRVRRFPRAYVGDSASPTAGKSRLLTNLAMAATYRSRSESAERLSCAGPFRDGRGEYRRADGSGCGTIPWRSWGATLAA